MNSLPVELVIKILKAAFDMNANTYLRLENLSPRFKAISDETCLHFKALKKAVNSDDEDLPYCKPIYEPHDDDYYASIFEDGWYDDGDDNYADKFEEIAVACEMSCMNI
jgi:hypothetical protein